MQWPVRMPNGNKRPKFETAGLNASGRTIRIMSGNTWAPPEALPECDNYLVHDNSLRHGHAWALQENRFTSINTLLNLHPPGWGHNCLSRHGGATFVTLELLAISFITFLTALHFANPIGAIRAQDLICFMMLEAICVCSEREREIALRPFSQPGL